MENVIIENVQNIERMTVTLETLRRNETVNVPNHQRVSANGTIQRLKQSSTKKFKCNVIVTGIDGYFTIKRVR